MPITFRNQTVTLNGVDITEHLAGIELALTGDLEPLRSFGVKLVDPRPSQWRQILTGQPVKSQLGWLPPMKGNA